MKKPTRADLQEAAEYLRNVHPDAESAATFRRVAEWLDARAPKQQAGGDS